MNSKIEFDPWIIHEAIIGSCGYTAGMSIISFLYVLVCPHLLGDVIGISILTAGVALVPLTMATLLFWILEERWKVIGE